MADWNKGTIDEFHARGGKGVGHFGDKLLLLTTRGAKSGEVRTTPLVYHRDGDRYVIAASKGGAPTHPAWYHNLVKHRDAEIEVGTESGSGAAIGADSAFAVERPKSRERRRHRREGGSLVLHHRNQQAHDPSPSR